jgi:DNA polymerase I
MACAEWYALALAPPSGRLDLSDDTFREMARAYPAVAPLRELRAALSQMRLSELAVGRDGRNRTMISAFRARTGRNQPSNTKFIFGPSVWLRGLIQPPPGYGIAYIDWAQQEFGIAAALSGDLLMMDAYRSGDPYLTFAKQAGAAPTNATKATHKAIRDQFKSTVLAVQYGMGADSLAQRIGQPAIRARELLRLHRETYRVFWRWSDAAVDQAMLTGSLHTVFGWRVRVPAVSNERSLRNFPMQANGAEMLRLACCLGTERGIEVCAPVHDAVLICAPLESLDADVARMQEAMREASRIVLNGFELGTDAQIVRYPDRYMDERGALMWGRVMNLIDGQLLEAA